MARIINYSRFVKDAADRMVGHADENQSIWVETLLTHTLSTLFRYQYPATPWATGDLISIDTSPPPGALGVQWTMLGEVGLFDSVADNADDLPLIDLQGSTQYNKAFTVGGAIAYSEQDLQASEMQGLFNIANEKGQAAPSLRPHARQLHPRGLVEELLSRRDQPRRAQGLAHHGRMDWPHAVADLQRRDLDVRGDLQRHRRRVHA
jgi:hypothetical protein